ncbi:MAG: chemotaxis protein CheW [Planctomycetota bacterium]
MTDNLEETKTEAPQETIQLVTFRVNQIILGVEISHVQEINRHLEITRVPQASPMIHGVVNLRGDVVTVIDPHRVFGIERDDTGTHQRNLILNIDGERIGVLVDQVSDILTVHPSELSRRPSNVRSIDRQFIESVYLRDEEIVVVLNALHLLEVVEHHSEAALANS